MQVEVVVEVVVLSNHCLVEASVVEMYYAAAGTDVTALLY